MKKNRKIVITNEQSHVEIIPSEIKKALELMPELDNFRLSIVYVDDTEISVFNEKYLKHTGPTDVLSFPISSKEGEIIVSAETALREAQERNIDVQGEILLYTFHGVLHLLGYDDHSDEEYEEMHAIERKLLEQLGYTWSWDD